VNLWGIGDSEFAKAKRSLYLVIFRELASLAVARAVDFEFCRQDGAARIYCGDVEVVPGGGLALLDENVSRARSMVAGNVGVGEEGGF